MHHPFFTLIALAGLFHGFQASPAAPAMSEQPDAVIDLSTRTDLDLVEGEWRYRDVEIIQVGFTGPGPDGQPTGQPVTTYDIRPHAGGVEFDDSDWEVIEPDALDTRRGAGRVNFNWYRIRVTIPAQVDGFDPTGSTVVFETSSGVLLDALDGLLGGVR